MSPKAICIFSMQSLDRRLPTFSIPMKPAQARVYTPPRRVKRTSSLQRLQEYSLQRPPELVPAKAAKLNLYGLKLFENVNVDMRLAKILFHTSLAFICCACSAQSWLRRMAFVNVLFFFVERNGTRILSSLFYYK